MGKSRTIEMDFYIDWVELLRERLMAMGYHLPKNLDPGHITLMYYNVIGRLISPQPREVHAAPDFPWPGRDHPNLKGFIALVKKIQAGEELTPHLSTKIRKASYKDMLLNDWGIHHLHLGVDVGADGFITRTKMLLYVLVSDTACHMITIGDHNSFSLQKMVETIHTTWPHLILRYRLKCEGVEYSPTDVEIEQLRKGGVTYPIQVTDGTVYMSPGGGYASSGDSERAAMARLQSRNRLGELEELVKEKVDEMAAFAANIGHPFGDKLHFKLRFMSDNRETFRITEIGSGVAFQIGD